MKKIIILLTVLIAVAINADAQWTEPSAVAANSQNVYCLISNGTTIFAGTGSAGVSISTNNGNNWTAANNGLTTTGISSFAISGGNVFAAGQGVFLTTNNGGLWTAVNNGLTNTTVNALAISGSTIFAGTDGGVFLSTNNGGLWTAANTGLTSQVRSLAISGTTIFAAVANDGAYVSNNNGGLWTLVNNGLTNSDVVSLALSGTTIFVGTSGGVFVSTNNGGLWTAVNNGLTNLNVYSLFVNGSTIFAGTDDGIFYSNNMGANWTSFNNGFPAATAVQAFTVSGTSIFAGIRLFPYGVWRRPLSEVITGIEENRDDISFNVYPNPFSSTTTLRTGNILKDASLIVYNSFGQQVKQIQNLSGQTITFQRDNLPGGVYFICLIQANKVISSDKLTITD